MNINSDKLRDLMISKGMNIGELAYKSGVTRQTISNLLNNRTKSCNFKTLNNIASSLEVNYKDII